jgi:FAD:protein FMN transferase
MGCAAQIVILAPSGSTSSLLARAGERLRVLEARWSRFIPDSEICRLNEHAGESIRVSHDTLLLLAAAQLGWLETRGRFDPLVALARPTANAMARLQIDWTSGTACMPPGETFDPAGIGKGMAADLVAEDLIKMGAFAAMVNVGGDLRAIGPRNDRPLVGDDAGGWRIGIDVSTGSEPVLIGLNEGGVATSSTHSFQLAQSADSEPHLIDPVTGGLYDLRASTATVIAPDAWRAEVWTKVVLSSGADGLRETQRHGLASLLCDGSSVEVNERMGLFLGALAV